MGFKAPEKLGSFSQNTEYRLFEAENRLILLNLSGDLLLYGAQRLLLSQSIDEFNVEVTLGLNISED